MGMEGLKMPTAVKTTGVGPRNRRRSALIQQAVRTIQKCQLMVITQVQPFPSILFHVNAQIMFIYVNHHNCLITLCASCGAVYCNRSCLLVCLRVCLWVCLCGSVTTITRKCLHRFSPNWVCR